MRNLGVFVAAALLVVCFTRPAAAVMQFYKVFLTEYIDNHPDPEYAEFVKREVKCFICHQGRKRANHNPFGEHLVKLLDRKKDAKNVEKIKAALAKVVAMHTDPDDPNSETYADRIAASKLPGGELEELKKEPDELTGP